MNDSLEQLRYYKEPKKVNLLTLETDKPVKFKLIKGAKVNKIWKTFHDNDYCIHQFQVRDLADGKFKRMSLTNFAFKTLGKEISMFENDKSLYKFGFRMVRIGEGVKIKYDVNLIYPERKRKSKRSK